VLAEGFCAEVALCSVVAVPAADCEPAPTLLDGVWLLTGGFAVELLLAAELWLEGAAWLLVSGVVAGALLDDAVPEELGFIEVPDDACPLVQESEIILMEVTCSDPPLDCVPCTSTWCPSWGLSMELSPFRVVS